MKSNQNWLCSGKQVAGLCAALTLLASAFNSTTRGQAADPAHGPPDHANNDNESRVVVDRFGKKMRENEVLVQWKENATDADVADAVTRIGLGVRKHIHTPAMKARGHRGLTRAGTKVPVEEAIQRLKNHPAVEFAEPNYVYTHQSASNDPYYTAGYLWGVCGDRGALINQYGVQATEAWDAGFVGSNTVYVGVIDEGIQVNHPDLAGNVWSNPYDPLDGLDNDGNGYADDAHGWNFYGASSSVFDASGDTHGTHVAGTIGAQGNNGVGVAGVNWDVTVISAKFLGPDGGSLADAIEAVDYFTDLKTRHKVNIVALNNSWGGGGYSQALHDAIIRAAKAGILFIAAAGNDGLNNDAYGAYPSNYDTRIGTSTQSAASYDSVIAVAAIDYYGAKATFSNYGTKHVDLGAPGVSILSTYPTDWYGYMDGTSMATPHVTGAAALYASTHPNATAAEIRNALLSSVIPTPSLSGVTSTGGRLDLSTIVNPPVAPQPTTPHAPTGLSATPGVQKVVLSWNSVSNATSYVVKRSTVSGGPYAVVASGITGNSYTDANNVVGGTTYYYVVAAINAVGTSPNSAQAYATALSNVPVAPSNVAATASRAQVNGNATATVTWAAVSGGSSYKVKRATSAAGPFTVVASGLTGTSYSQTITANGTTYYYVVTAVNSSGESANSAAASVRPVPPAPSNLTATAASRSQINLAWVDNSSDDVGFKVELSTDNASWRQLGTVGNSVRNVGVTGLSANRTYWFRIRSYTSSANTPYSNVASARTLP